MGAGQVGQAIFDWVIGALHDHPLLVLPTLVIALGVVGLAAVEAATITVQVATLMVHHYRHGLARLFSAVRELWDALFPQRGPRRTIDDVIRSGSARTSVVQQDRLAQQQLFDRTRVASSSSRRESA
jgi:hypothetical protein